MPSDSSRSIRVILFLGVVVFGLLWLSSLGLKRGLRPDESERVPPTEARTAFSGERAMSLAESLTALGPRPAGSDALVSTKDLVEREARQAGLAVLTLGKDCVAAQCRGALGSEGGLVFLTRLDTAPESPGANGAASGSATLLELGRAIGGTRRGQSISFVWLLDGERFRAEVPKEVPTLEPLLAPLRPSALVVVEQVGDCYLKLGADKEGHLPLRELLIDTAERQGYAHYFPANGPQARDVYGVHTWLPQSAYLVDPVYGGSLTEHVRLHGKPEDTIEHLCPASLQAVGDVLYDAAQACDLLLNRRN
jgi:hypothetical protein